MPTAHRHDRGLASLLWNAAADRPEHPGIIDHGVPHSWAAVRDRAAGIALSLRAVGVEPGDRVVIILERGAAAAAAIFGAHAAGGVPVVLNERLRPRQVEYAIARVGARALITTASLLLRQPRPLEISLPVVDIDRTDPSDGVRLPVIARSPDDVAQLVFTSGSTGLPRAATFTHAAIDAGVSVVSRYLGLRPSDRVASVLSFSAVYGLNQLLCTTYVGATLVVESSPVPATLVAALRKRQITTLAAVPPLWLQLLGAPSFTEAPLMSLRQMQNAGGHLPVHAVKRLREMQPQAELFLQYGQTETFRGTFLPPAEVDRRPDSMGRPIPGAEILVLDEHQRPCPPGVTGELVHRGPTIATGYWDDADATARVFRLVPGGASADRAVFSGDLVRRDEDGFLYFVSRRDRLIKSLGFRIGPDEIGSVLFASNEIRECAIDAEPDGVRGDRIVAYVVMTPIGSVERLKRYCAIELPRHMQPARIVVLESLPKLPGGKYDVQGMANASGR